MKEIGNYYVIFSTLWSEIEHNKLNLISSVFNDFRMIKNEKNMLNADTYNTLHKKSNEYIAGELLKYQGKKNIVVSHHIPTLKNYPSKYLDSEINSCFVSENRDLILNYEPDYWIYGHHHHNTNQFQIGKTILLTNQLGYIQKKEHAGFNRAKIIPLNLME